jgi:hypothetical protein
MEDNLKISKVENLSNPRSDFPQIVNLNIGDQTKIEYYLKGRGHPKSKILYLEYLSNHGSDLLKRMNQNLKLLKMKMNSYVRQPIIIKSGATSNWILLKLS